MINIIVINLLPLQPSLTGYYLQIVVLFAARIPFLKNEYKQQEEILSTPESSFPLENNISCTSDFQLIDAADPKISSRDQNERQMIRPK